MSAPNTGATITNIIGDISGRASCNSYAIALRPANPIEPKIVATSVSSFLMS